MAVDNTIHTLTFKVPQWTLPENDRVYRSGTFDDDTFE